MSYLSIIPLQTRTARKSWLDDLQDDGPSAQSILEERELLDALMFKLDDLEPDGRRICELLLQDKSEREIAAIMGISKAGAGV